MRNDQISTESYATVIADLRAKRDELDRTIRMLEAMVQLESPSPTQTISPRPEKAADVARPRPAKRRGPPPRSNGLGERCMRILRERSAETFSTRQVTDLVLEFGFRLETVNPTNNVFSALSHRAKVSGDVERVGSNWSYVGDSGKTQ